ncbi:bifunctional 5,10-methylenetetrahydrofolate dehydrogenase/5,10-methenyltetrahydrofolate cyclohydrolase [Parasphaerochaeta coccoides]|uniref:Bifunctional protein FolD n=1 Tax=Parasphaerochaeta coccoides (strain ATCC BAA-1237 / DSM 17374 / SPN1) TaxID=760011 RepID=F4GJ71_PARC1|nr:bifunctional 5,10-methylenetetrahydrofolate dehydrogenase/5,10-methenyltetrahydrofolate cyclohydrolase [Parasphaerochaeta coccoides]AEC01711.1 5,10-methylenetetrahydrofolate dehydrogenase (NADP+); methenyltetrahydrofolate cyclohydrolase [Parasphaerochaeta coccoides DSM 17374]
MQVLSGKDVAMSVLEHVRKEAVIFGEKYGRMPSIAVILVGEDPASQTYVAAKKKSALELGYGHKDYHLSVHATQQELLELVRELNADDDVDGILVQMPLPPHMDENCVIDTIDPAKDVDGFHPVNAGKILLGRSSLVSCTPKGVLRIMDHYGIRTAGKDVVIIGRSSIVGKPMAALLMQKGRDATVTVCHSCTLGLKEHVRRADIIIAAVGHPHMITADMVKSEAVVIDVGITRVTDLTKKKGWRLVGDVDYDNVAPRTSAITPVPGGVGPMTIAMLMENTLQAAQERKREQKGENA